MVDPYILSDPAIYKAIEEAVKGNIAGGEAFEVLVQNALKAVAADNISVFFGCSGVTYTGAGPPETEAIWGVSQAIGADDSIRVPTPFDGRFQDMVVNVAENDLDSSLDVTLLANGSVIGDPKEHTVRYAAGETGLKFKFLAAPTLKLIDKGSLMSFSFLSTSIVGTLKGSASIHLVFKKK